MTGLPETVEVARRGDIVTVINHGAEPVPINVPGTDILTGEDVRGFTLAPFEYRLVRQA